MAGPGRGAPDMPGAAGPWRARAGLLAWCLALVGGTALFHSLGDGPLTPPPLAPDAWAVWAEGRDPLVATVAVLRLVVLGLNWYLVGATSIGVLARVLRAARLIRVADALTVPALRRLLQAALGASLATAMVVSAATPRADLGVDAGPASNVEVVDPDAAPEHDGAVTFAASGSSPDASPEVHRDGTDLAGTVRLAVADGGRYPGDGQVRLTSADDELPDEGPGQVRLTSADEGLPDEGPGQVRLAAADEEPNRVTIAGADDGDATDGPMTRPPGLDLLENGATARTGGPDGPDGSVDVDDAQETAADGDGPDGGHTVAAGESFWGIADDVLADHLDRAPTDREVAAYVERMVEHNRDRLADPENPDLIFPGQAFDLPPFASEEDA